MVPVVIFGFNRFEEFRTVLRACSGLPVIVYLDGPRSSVDLVAQRLILDLVRSNNYVIAVHQSDINLGCKRNVMHGVRRTLEEYPSAIFLEDDCVPVSGFYEYALKALNTFYKNPKIGLISLSNLIDSGISNSTRSSIFINCWGWATWSNRIAITTDVYTSSSDIVMLKKSSNFSTLGWWQKLYWRNIFIFSMNQSSIWDFHIQFRFFVNDMYSIVPPHNLINNIGFSDKATHTQFSRPPAYTQKNYANSLPEIMIDEINFNYASDYFRDQKVIRVLYQYSLLRLFRLILGNIFRMLRRIIC
jgi:hypothetical protein